MSSQRPGQPLFVSHAQTPPQPMQATAHATTNGMNTTQRNAPHPLQQSHPLQSTPVTTALSQSPPSSTLHLAPPSSSAPASSYVTSASNHPTTAASSISSSPASASSSTFFAPSPSSHSTPVSVTPLALSTSTGVPHWSTRPVCEYVVDALHTEMVKYFTKQLKYIHKGDDDKTFAKRLYSKLDGMGFHIGVRYAERCSRDHPLLDQPLDMVKFCCKELWITIFKKQIDKLQTNYKGIYVLHDYHFRWLSRVYALSGEMDSSQLVDACRIYTALPCGILRGALYNLGMPCSVKVDANKLPAITLTVMEEKAATAAATSTSTSTTTSSSMSGSVASVSKSSSAVPSVATTAASTPLSTTPPTTHRSLSSTNPNTSVTAPPTPARS